jgi:hypothetical protein
MNSAAGMPLILSEPWGERPVINMDGQDGQDKAISDFKFEISNS